MSGVTIADTINVRQSLTWCAHLWKAVTQQHHREMRAVFRPYPSLARRGDSAAALAAFLKDLRYRPVGGWDAFEPPADFLFVPDEKS